MEETLFLLIKGKNKKAVNYFYNFCGATLYNVIDRNLTDKVQCETVFQDVLLKITQNIDHYDPRISTLYPWMFGIAQAEIQTVNLRSFNRGF
jgi:DNA-directed RNA polymerase specialized sigma24 family protein